MYRLTTSIKFAPEQVIEFGRITGDDGPVHSRDLVVQGGLIVSCLPKILNDIMTRDNLHEGYTHSVSAVLEAKFRNKLPADLLVNIDFEYQSPKSKISKLNWRLYDDELEYCTGFWVIYKSRN